MFVLINFAGHYLKGVGETIIMLVKPEFLTAKCWCSCWFLFWFWVWNLLESWPELSGSWLLVVLLDSSLVSSVLFTPRVCSTWFLIAILLHSIPTKYRNGEEQEKTKWQRKKLKLRSIGRNNRIGATASRIQMIKLNLVVTMFSLFLLSRELSFSPITVVAWFRKKL